MPPILKGRSPALIFGATFAIGLLWLLVAALATSLSSGISEEQRASQAVYTAFGGYHEDCHVMPTDRPTLGRASYWCGYWLRPDTCKLVIDSSSGTRYYSCYRPPEGIIEGGDPTGPSRWACVVDRGGDTGMARVGVRSALAEQSLC